MGQSSTWIGVILAVILIFINGVLASAEMALVGLNETKLRKKSVEGDKKAAFLLHMKENPHFFSAVQVGLTWPDFSPVLSLPIYNYRNNRDTEQAGQLCLWRRLGCIFDTMWSLESLCPSVS